MKKAQPIQPTQSQNLGVHMKIGPHEFSASGTEDFIELQRDWWQEHVEVYDQKKAGNDTEERE